MLTIDIAVGGRFHSDRMARSFKEQGDEVHLFTSFPKNRFPALDADSITSFLAPEIVFRLAQKLGQESWGDEFKMQVFGRQVARASTLRSRDLFLGWSSFSLETLKTNHAKRKVVVRDSAHIDHQYEILAKEFSLRGLSFPKRQTCLAREREEYELCDQILVPSRYAKRTFVERGFSPDKITVLPLGIDTALFHPPADFTVKLPIKILYFGTLSLQKGVPYLLEATSKFSSQELVLELVGSLSEEFAPLLGKFSHARHRPAMPQSELAQVIRENHVLVFPTLHDGFGQVVPQALASGLAVITTTSCGAADLITEGQNGFVVEPGNARAIETRLRELVAAPGQLEALRRKAAASLSSLSWSEYSRSLITWAHDLCAVTRKAL